MPLDRLIARYNFADFNLAGADAILGRCDKVASAVAAVTTATAISPAAIAGGKPYLIDANTI